MTEVWPGLDRQRIATSRILDAAGELFALHGASSVGMAEVAAAAGCSRATVYRYFPTRDLLRLAFVQRSARRLGADIARTVSSIADPAERIEKAVMGAVDGVRDDPLLAAWFRSPSVGIATDLAAASEVIESLAESATGEAGADDLDAARWTVRVIISLLSMPGRNRDEEVRFVRGVLVSAIVLSGDSLVTRQ